MYRALAKGRFFSRWAEAGSAALAGNARINTPITQAIMRQ
jgi:hypothetical protein